MTTPADHDPAPPVRDQHPPAARTTRPTTSRVQGHLRALAELVRAPAALTVPGDVLAGAAAAGAPTHRALGLSAASVCLYWAGMAANDWADRDLDAVERPERPIPSGRIPAPVALGVAAGLTVAGLALAARAGGRRSLTVAVPLAAAVWTYDLRLKNTAAGPAGMATCRALDVLLGTGSRSVVRALPAAAVTAAHTYAVTALSRHEVSGRPPATIPAATLATTAAVTAALAFRRRPADRALASSGDRASFVSSGHVLAGSGLPGGAGSVLWAGGSESASRGRTGGSVVGAVLAGGYAASLAGAQARVLTTPGAATVRQAVGAGITAFPALQGALVARAGRPLTGLALAAVMPLARLLARKVSPT